MHMMRGTFVYYGVRYQDPMLPHRCIIACIPIFHFYILAFLISGFRVEHHEVLMTFSSNPSWLANFGENQSISRRGLASLC